MPLVFLQKIKSIIAPKSQVIRRKDTVYKQLQNEHVLGAYVFSCKELNANQPLFNDGLPALIFMPKITDTVHLTKKGERMEFNAAWACCGVINDTHWHVPQDLEYLLVIRFKPASFYSIFGIDPKVFQANPIQNLIDLVDDRWAQVFTEMYQREVVTDKLSFLDQVLDQCNADDNYPHILNLAVAYIDEKKGNTTVRDVLNQLGKRVNSKWLYRNFVKYIGVSPKKYISLQRFIYTYSDYMDHKSNHRFDVALHSGYYDYNHFFKDFKRYIGLTPTQHMLGE